MKPLGQRTKLEMVAFDFTIMKLCSLSCELYYKLMTSKEDDIE